MKDSTIMKIVKIEHISEIRFGCHAHPNLAGDTNYLQVRQFDEAGMLLLNNAETIDINEKLRSQILMDGDVLFVGKGNRLFAWCYHEESGPTIASSIFFVLRPDKELVYPEYLSAILNAPQSKNAFRQLGGGTNIFSIRKSELGAFEIPLPPMQQQKIIAEVASLHQQEIELVQKIITEKQNLYTALISKLVK